jgi:Ca2+:H+ antiporter
MKYVNYALLAFVALALLGEYLHWSPILVFFAAALGVIPLAGFMGTATEELAHRTGPRLGGFLNATLGNAAELIITLVAIAKGRAATDPEVREGLMELVKASITGSIIGNLLLILGLGILLGGLRHGRQTFDRTHASVNATMLILAITAIGVPSFFSGAIAPANQEAVEYLTLGVAAVMIVVYALGVLFSFRQVSGIEAQPAAATAHACAWSVPTALGVLVATTVFIAWLSEVLVGAVEPVVESLGMSEFFLGVILVPLVGNVAEHLVAVQAAARNQMELALAIALGSSLQIALFVAPFLVFVSLAMGNPLQLTFNYFEVAALVASALIASLIALDGESNWLEGAQLLCVYAILGLAFYFLPS